MKSGLCAISKTSQDNPSSYARVVQITFSPTGEAISKIAIYSGKAVLSYLLGTVLIRKTRMNVVRVGKISLKIDR